MQRILAYSGSSDDKKAALWLLSNIVLNSMQDIEAVLASGIMVNVSLACRSSSTSIKKEAIYTVSNMINKLCIENEFEKIETLLPQYNIEENFVDVLRNDLTSP